MEIFVFTRRNCPACEAFFEYMAEHYPQVELLVMILEDIEGDPLQLAEWLARTGMVQQKIPAIAFDKTPKTYNSAQAIKELGRRLGCSASPIPDETNCSAAGCSV